MPNFRLPVGIARFHLSADELAGLLGAAADDARAWLQGTAPCPGPVAAYLRLLGGLDAAAGAKEIERVRPAVQSLPDGMYRLEHRGLFNNGAGLMLVDKGRVRGTDTGGGRYEGTCHLQSDGPNYHFSVDVYFPPNANLVNGVVVGPEGLRARLTGDFARPDPVALAIVQLGGQPVEVKLTYFGPLPEALAA